MKLSTRTYVFLLIIAFFSVACGGSKDPSADQKKSESNETININRITLVPEMAKGIKTDEIKLINLADKIQVPSQIKVDEQELIRVGANVTGRIVKVTAKLGDNVDAGTTLAKISSPELTKAQLEYLRAHSLTVLNERAAKMLQRDTPEDLLGKNIWTEYPEGVGQPFQLAYEKAMQTQQIVVFEEHYEPWDLWFENRVFPSSDGITIYFSDITERKKSELALREAASAFSSIRDAVITTDTELTILTINHAFERVCGYEESEALGKTASFLQDFDSAESFESAAEHLQEQGFWQGKIFGRRKCGAIFPGWLSANLIDAQPGLPKRFIFVLSDITE